MTNTNGEVGITLHIDAGPRRNREGRSYSRNVHADHQDGDEVSLKGVRPDILPIGKPGEFEVGAFQVAALDATKDRYFGTADKNAREFAFRYGVLGDFLDYTAEVTNAVGNRVGFDVAEVHGPRGLASLSTPVPLALVVALKNSWAGFADGAAAGEIRRIRDQRITFVTHFVGDVAFLAFNLEGPMPNPAPSAGSHLIFLGAVPAGMSEIFMTGEPRDPALHTGHRLPGNDVLMSVPLIRFKWTAGKSPAGLQLGRVRPATRQRALTSPAPEAFLPWKCPGPAAGSPGARPWVGTFPPLPGPVPAPCPRRPRPQDVPLQPMERAMPSTRPERTSRPPPLSQPMVRVPPATLMARDPVHAGHPVAPVARQGMPWNLKGRAAPASRAPKRAEKR